MSNYFDATTASFTTKAEVTAAVAAAKKAKVAKVTINTLGEIPYIRTEAEFKKLMAKIKKLGRLDTLAFVVRHGQAWLANLLGDGQLGITADTAAVIEPALLVRNREFFQRQTHEAHRKMLYNLCPFILTRNPSWGFPNSGTNNWLPAKLKLKDLKPLDIVLVRFYDEPSDVRVLLTTKYENKAPAKRSVSCRGLIETRKGPVEVRFETYQILELVGSVTL